MAHDVILITIITDIAKNIKLIALIRQMKMNTVIIVNKSFVLLELTDSCGIIYHSFGSNCMSNNIIVHD